MHKVDAAGATPANEFTDGDLPMGVLRTLLAAKWHNTIQRELVAPIAQAGIALDAAQDNQLMQAVALHVESMDELEALPVPQIPAGRTVLIYLRGYWAGLAGGEGFFKWNATAVAISALSVQPNTLPAQGRWERVRSLWIDSSWFGAVVGKPAAIVTPAIQAAIDFIGRNTGSIKRGSIQLPDGEVSINGQLEIAQQAIYFRGTEKTIIRWEGNNASAMFRSGDASRCVWDTMTLLGNDNSQPTAGIFLDVIGVPPSFGSNEFFVVNNVQFGRRYAADTTAAGKMQRGVWMNGAIEDDTFRITNSQFHDCTVAGIDNDNGNAIWGMLDNLTFNVCGYGIKTGCDTLGINLNFNRCTIADVLAYRQVQVELIEVNSEHSVLPFKVEQGASLHVKGGRLNVMAELIGSYWADCAGAADVSFRDFWVYENGANGKKIRHPGSSLSRGSLYIRTCDIAGGDDGSAFEFDADVLSLGVDVDIVHGPYVARRFQRYNAAYDPPSLTDGNFAKTAQVGIAGTDINAGSFFLPAFSVDLQGVLLTGQAAAGQLLAALFTNETGGIVDLAAGMVRWRKIENKEIARRGSAVFAPADQADGAGITTQVTVPGAALGDFVYWSDTATTENWIVTSYVSAANTVSVRYQNESGGVLGKASGTLTAVVLRESAFDYLAAVTYDPPSLADGSGTTTTISVPGASLGDFVLVSFSNDLQGVIVTAWVSAADTVSVRFQNETGGAVDLAGVLKAGVFKRIG